jgi:REP element-mobilizing transposase RayT
MPEPLYAAAHVRVAYQLHWSLTLYLAHPLPEPASWWLPLNDALEPDGVRLLEHRPYEGDSIQLFASTLPHVSPADLLRLVKGRLQYILRQQVPKLWQRHYAVISVGDASNDVLQDYVRRQVVRHPQAGDNINERLKRVQYHNPSVDLGGLRSSSHGRFTYNLHIVLETADHLIDVREAWLTTTRDMIIGACRKKDWLLSRLGLVGNHLHVLVGCQITDAPRDVALSLQNNVAYAHGMKRVFEPSFYVGTFGAYDHNAIRRELGKFS